MEVGFCRVFGVLPAGSLAAFAGFLGQWQSWPGVTVMDVGRLAPVLTAESRTSKVHTRSPPPASSPELDCTPRGQQLAWPVNVIQGTGCSVFSPLLSH